MKHYSYFIVKPDGVRFMNEILNILESKNFKSIYFFSIQDFEEITKKLYHKHYREKGKKFEIGFKSYLYGIREIYNNFGILIVVGDEEREYEELCNEVFRTKAIIRKRFSNDNIGIATNIEDGENNNIFIVSKNGEYEKPRCLNGNGYHRVNDLNIIHCPDPNIETTLEELRILVETGIISDENLIKKDMLDLIVKYKCSNFLEDMKQEQYSGVITSNISGFISSCIRKEDNER